jgi:hypothetical protein
MTNPRNLRRAAALLLASGLGGLASCSSPTEPTADLAGEWSYSYSTVAPVDDCPTAPAGYRAGCSGSGTLTLTQDGTRLGGTAVVRGSCQSCSTVADYFGRRAVTGSWRGGDIEFEFSDDVGDCRYSAAVPEGSPPRVNGTVTCTFGPSGRGNWSMTR